MIMMKKVQSMYSKCDNIEIMINDEADEIVKELLKSLQKRYQNKLEKRWKVVSLSLIMFIYSIINVLK